MQKIEKRFYSLMNKNGVIGVKEQDGYQIEYAGITLYVYEEFYKSEIYFIDPNTGLAIYTMDDVGIDDIEYYPDDPIAKYLARLEEAQQKKEYSLQKKVFRKYKEARLFDEKCQSTIQDVRRKDLKE